MQDQQLKFALIFIGLGIFLGWFSNSAFNDVWHKNTDVNACEVSPQTTVSIPPVTQAVDVVSIDQDTSQFEKLLFDKQYSQALSLFKAVSIDKKNKLNMILKKTIHEMLENSGQDVFSLLDVFLSEFYDNSALLLLQANAYTDNKRWLAALNSYLLARSYAQDNEQYIEINQLIHDFSLLAFEQFQADKNWPLSIDFFEKLIEKDAQFAYYHLALAKSYIKNHEKDLALLHLQFITADPHYGIQASELLERTFVDDTVKGIKLEKQGEHYIVDMTIADEYPVKLMIDTGASYSSLSPYTLAQLLNEQLAKKVGRNTVYTAGGKVEADIYEVKSMTIDGFTVNNIRVVELELQSPLNEPPLNEATANSERHFEGLLGVNFLNEFNFSIDPQSKRLFLTPKI
ncbi:retropepsin-like aspartic protease [sulfur-oxidizing endosymbiont of Gigantopelta aegis]|uniref:retropepsin-like aspartic protease n=1 Tax=sulfur-oxidizing endosymbiont of Gigantopelta aegis TaxID=2794934 RepID=UPI0018DE2289|nr:retropepsin-like aspartic protease [sulfur-oxidizing endosymbiont of Gigantopelta aegis]